MTSSNAPHEVDAVDGGDDHGGPDLSTLEPADSALVPPAHCVAPCLWEIVGPCVPELGDCIGNEQPDSFTYDVCDPTTGWSKRRTSASSAGAVFSVSYQGQTCYSVRWGGKGPAGQLFSNGERDAWVVADNVWCSLIPSADDPPDYVLDRSRPECGAWDEFFLPVSADCDTVEVGDCP